MSRTISHVIDYGGPTGGSFMPAIESLSRAVNARGERFLVFATEVRGATWPAELVAAGADVRLVTSEVAVADGLRSSRPAIVHSHFTRYDLPALRAAPGARVFWHIHSHREDRSALAHVKAFIKYRLVGRQVEALVPVSETLGNECVDFFAARSSIRVVQNGIDTQRFRPPTPTERNAARAMFGIAADDRVILFFERVAYKGGATVRAAMSRLPDYRIMVAGGTAEARAAFGSPPRVIAIERAADARQLYWASDVLAFASDNEAFGFVLAEGLACGIPVAATDIPIVREICAEINQVALFPVGDPDGLASAVQQLMSPRAWNGRERVVDRFDLGRWTSEMLKLYDAV